MLGAAVKLMEERADELKFLLAAETGQPPTIVDMMQYGAAMSAFQYYAGAADKFTWRDFREGVYGETMVLREPIGVVAAVTAWNVPLFLAATSWVPRWSRAAPSCGEAGRRRRCRCSAWRSLRRGRAARGRAFRRTRRPRHRARADRQPGDRQVHVHRQQRGRQGDRQGSRPRSSSRAARASAASPRRSSSRTPTWTRLPMLLFSGLMNCGQACVGQTRILAPRSRYDEVVEGRRPQAPRDAGRAARRSCASDRP